MPKMMRFFFIACIAMLGVLACKHKPEVKPLAGRYYSGVLFSRPYHIDVVGDSTDFRPQIDSIIHVYESLLNGLDPQSLISKINVFSSEDSVFVFNDSTRAFGLVYDIAKDLHRQTMQYYDPTITPLKRAWMLTKSRGELEPNLDSLFDFVGFDHSQSGNVLIDLNETTTDGYTYKESQIRKRDVRVELDFSAIAAAAALDQIAQCLRDKKVAQFRIKYGHSVLSEGAVVDTLSVIPIGVGVDSSDQYIRLQRGAFSCRTAMDKMSMIDPTYGYPVDNEIVYVAVQAPTLVEAEVFSEAFMIMGLERAMEYYGNNETSKMESFMFYGKKEMLQSASTEGFDRLMILSDSTAAP